MKYVQIAAATTALILSSQQTHAEHPRAELLADRDNARNSGYSSSRVGDYEADHEARHRHGGYRQGSYRHGPAHRSPRHGDVEYRQHHYDNARRYAAAATRQAQEACDLGFYSDHPRWSVDFQRHFNWALRADAWEIEREARKRAKELRQLRHHARYQYGYPR